jgi:membrane fusion protein (multidrug efflux system)
MLPTAFAKTLHEMERSRASSSLWKLAAGLALLAAIAYWMFRVPVVLYETSADARLEIASAAAVVQAPLTGRVIRADLALGQHVNAGDILVRLDALPEELRANEETTRATAILPEIKSLEAQITAEESAGVEEQHASQSAIEEARLRVREAETPAKQAELERRRLERLKREGLTADRDYERALSDLEKYERAIATARAAIARLQNEQQTRERQRAVRVAAIRTEITRLEGGRANANASLRRVTYDVERRLIRAPISGTIGEATVLRSGSVLSEGARIASIVPAGQLRIVAFFPPQAAYGRLRQGAPARLRLKGFPWTEFGAVEARVAEVAAEERDGRSRVELDVLPSPTLRVKLHHGMPGEIEVEVERTPPYQLLLRAAGQWITAPTSSH